RLAITYGILCVFMFICSLMEIIPMLGSNEGSADHRLGSVMGFLLVIALEMALFGGKSLAYYIRVRKKYNNIGK
ncbi:MAG: hypothetical protein II773_07315, partial [Oscillospiraceae bacterium]|nr:hypothetical protein [Oscillospiraceae bacterium]